jgi:hypothetical protein
LASGQGRDDAPAISHGAPDNRTQPRQISLMAATGHDTEFIMGFLRKKPVRDLGSLLVFVRHRPFFYHTQVTLYLVLHPVWCSETSDFCGPEGEPIALHKPSGLEKCRG